MDGRDSVYTDLFDGDDVFYVYLCDFVSVFILSLDAQNVIQ